MQEETEMYFWNKISPVPILVLIPALDEGRKWNTTPHWRLLGYVLSLEFKTNYLAEKNHNRKKSRLQDYQNV